MQLVTRDWEMDRVSVRYGGSLLEIPIYNIFEKLLKLVLDESIEVFTCGDDLKFGGVERANGVRDKCSFSLTGMRTSATAGVV